MVGSARSVLVDSLEDKVGVLKQLNSQFQPVSHFMDHASSLLPVTELFVGIHTMPSGWRPAQLLLREVPADLWISYTFLHSTIRHICKQCGQEREITSLRMPVLSPWPASPKKKQNGGLF